MSSMYKKSKFFNDDFWKLDMMFKLASALKKLHNIGLCHFDLKEDNIFMMNDYTPVLGDMGLMQSARKAKQEGFWGGTPIYMGRKANNGGPIAAEECKADIFSLGIIYYGLIRGKVKFFINSTYIENELQITRNNILKKTGELIESMLNELKPSTRPSVNQILKDLTKVIQGYNRDAKNTYLQAEESLYNNPPKGSLTTEKNKSELLSKLEERKKIYMGSFNDEEMK